MKQKVTAKSQNSSMCFVCGLKNPAGLRASFFELESGDLCAVYNARDVHQSYPGRLHGGICSTLIDEVLGRAIVTRSNGKFWSATAELTTRGISVVPTATTGSRKDRMGRTVKERFEEDEVDCLDISAGL